VALIGQFLVFLFMYLLLQQLAGAFWNAATLFVGSVIIAATVGFFAFTIHAIVKDTREQKAYDSGNVAKESNNDGKLVAVDDGNDRCNESADSEFAVPLEETIEIDLSVTAVS